VYLKFVISRVCYIKSWL